MKTIALIETNKGGHHLTYLRIFSQTLLSLGYKVMAFYPEPKQVSEWITSNCPKQAEQFHAFEMQEPKPRKLPIIGRLPRKLPIVDRIPQLTAVLTRWRHTAAVIQKASAHVGDSPDLVFLNWLDSYLSYYLNHHIIDQIFPYNWSGIYFRPGHLRFGQRSLPVLRTPLSHYAIAQSSRCRALAVLDEGTVEELQSRIRNLVVAFPDVTDESQPDLSSAIVKEIREKAGQRKIIGLIGSLSKRKGMLTLLEAAQRSIGENWFFVFAGPFNQHTFHQEYDQKLTEEQLRAQNIIKSAPSNCFFHFEHISDGPQFNALIDACDVLFAAYENFPYSSNILTKAAVFRKPLIVSDGFCMGARVQKFKMGVSIPEGDVSRCIEALRYLCERYELNNHQLPSDFEGYRSLHSTEQLGAVFEAILGSGATKLATVGSK